MIDKNTVEKAAQACEAERIEDTGTDSDLGYNRAVRDCAAAVRALATTASSEPASRGAAQGRITCDLTDYSTPVTYSNGTGASPAPSAKKDLTQPPQRMNITEAREYLIEFMMQHFTDKTFHRYIRGELSRNGLAGDFAWQMANALKSLTAPSASASPAAPETQQQPSEFYPECPRDMKQAREWIAGLRARIDSLLNIINTPSATLPVAGSQQVPGKLEVEREVLEHWLSVAAEPIGSDCCGQPDVGAQYGGMNEQVCCGNPEPAFIGLAALIDAMDARHKVVIAELAAAAPAVPVPAAHPDDLAVERFATAMKAKLAKKRAEGRGGWETPECTDQFLAELLMNHTKKGDPVDVANLAMMLHQRNVDHMDIAVLVLRSAALGFAKRVAPMFMQEQSAEGKKGLVFVPAEPTQEMCDAGRSEAGHWQNSGEPWGAMTWFRIYRAMLAAAPSLQQPKTGSQP